MGQGEWYWCLKHSRVEPADGCADAERLGPYASQAEAEQALSRAAARSREWDDDPRWNDDPQRGGAAR